MPTIQLYDVHSSPLRSHHVRAPGGYEWWQIVVRQPAKLMIADIFEGSPFDAEYLRQYRAYFSRPTREHPPLPEQFHSSDIRFYQGDRLIDQIDRAELQWMNGSAILTSGKLRWEINTGMTDDQSAVATFELPVNSRLSAFHRIETPVLAKSTAGVACISHCYATEPLAQVLDFLWRGQVLQDRCVLNATIYQPCNGNKITRSWMTRSGEDSGYLNAEAYWLSLDACSPSGRKYPSSVTVGRQIWDSPKVLDDSGHSVRLVYQTSSGESALAEMIHFA